MSRSYENILNQVSQLVDKNVGEIVLSGINLGTYRDNGLSFGDLIGAILNRAKQTLLRISSIEPYSLDETFFSTLTHPNLSPHIHLALQGTSNEVLKQMKRRYTLEEFYHMVRLFYEANPDFSISTDIITGFPTENETMFLKGMDYIRKCGFSKLHVFPYSPREYTVAKERYRDQDLPVLEKKRRTRQLRYLSKELENAYSKRLLSKRKQQRFILETLQNPQREENGDYKYYKGTSEYYVKGVMRLPSSQKVTLGERVMGRLVSVNPTVF